MYKKVRNWWLFLIVYILAISIFACSRDTDKKADPYMKQKDSTTANVVPKVYKTVRIPTYPESGCKTVDEYIQTVIWQGKQPYISGMTKVENNITPLMEKFIKVFNTEEEKKILIDVRSYAAECDIKLFPMNKQIKIHDNISISANPVKAVKLEQDGQIFYFVDYKNVNDTGVMQYCSFIKNGEQLVDLGQIPGYWDYAFPLKLGKKGPIMFCYNIRTSAGGELTYFYIYEKSKGYIPEITPGSGGDLGCSYIFIDLDEDDIPEIVRMAFYLAGPPDRWIKINKWNGKSFDVDPGIVYFNDWDNANWCPQF